MERSRRSKNTDIKTMPSFDRTGPLGMGPRTGRGVGPCGYGSDLGRGYGYGMGRGFGRFWNSSYVPTLTREEEAELLKEEAEELENELKSVKDRIGRLTNK